MFKGRKLPPKSKLVGEIFDTGDEDLDLILESDQPKSKPSPTKRGLKEEVILLLDLEDEAKSKSPSTSRERSNDNDNDIIIVNDEKSAKFHTRCKRQKEMVTIDSDSESDLEAPNTKLQNKTSRRTVRPPKHRQSKRTNAVRAASSQEQDNDFVQLESDPEEKMHEVGSSSVAMPEKKRVGIRFQHKGVVKRIQVNIDDTFRSIIPIVAEAFNLKTKELIRLERDGEKIKSEASPASLNAFNFVSDILYVAFFSLNESLSQESYWKDDEECPDGFLRVRLREKVIIPHGECNACITRCGSCSESAFLTETSRKKLRKDAEFKGKIREGGQFRDFMDHVKNRLTRERNINEIDVSNIQIKFSFDGDDLEEAQTPEDLDMDSDSLIDVVIVDKRMCPERICSCNEQLQTKRTRATRNSGRRK
jgi:hypothetical protein